MGRKCLSGSSLTHSTNSGSPRRASMVGPGDVDRESPHACWRQVAMDSSLDLPHRQAIQGKLVSGSGGPGEGRNAQGIDKFRQPVRIEQWRLRRGAAWLPCRLPGTPAASSGERTSAPDTISPVVSFKISLLMTRRAFEIEHAGDRVRDAVERSFSEPFSLQPVVFDEGNNGSLIGKRMVDKIHSRPRRNGEHRQARTESAAALRMSIGRVYARQRARSITAASGTGKSVPAAAGLVHDRAHLVVVPAVGIVIGDDHGRVFPFGRALQKVDYLDGKCLLIERIGISGVPVLIRRQLSENSQRESCRP